MLQSEQQSFVFKVCPRRLDGIEIQTELSQLLFSKNAPHPFYGGKGLAKIGLGELVGIEVYVELSQFSVQEYPASFVRVERGLMSKFNQQD